MLKLKRLYTAFLFVLIPILNIFSNNISEHINKQKELYLTTDSVHYLDNAIKYLFQSDNIALNADIYRLNGEYKMIHGSEILAHDNLYKAINLYIEDGSNESIEWASSCYSSICGSYFYQEDSLGMKKVLNQMKNLKIQYPDINTLQYHYYFSISVYYGMLYEQTKVTKYQKLYFENAHKTIEFLENIPLKKRHKLSINSCLIFHNLTWGFFSCSIPKDIDSALYYLKITEQKIPLLNNNKQRTQIEIATYHSYASLYLYEGKYNDVIVMINKIERILDNTDLLTENNLINERAAICRLYVELYKATDDINKALKYQTKLNSINKKLYNIEKNQAINDLQVRYEVEKKSAYIIHLSQQNQSMRLTIMVISVLILVLILIIALIVMRKRSIEQKYYEAALEADNKLESKIITEQSLLKKLINEYPKHRDKLESVDIKKLEDFLNTAIAPPSTMEKKYMICFMAKIKAIDIADMFSVEQPTVYTVKYRIKRKFNTEKYPF